MTAVTIFGTGAMATAIGAVLEKGGASVDHIRHGQGAGAAIAGDIVVLAVPYTAVSEILAGYADQLSDHIVVDITNPLDFETFEGLVVPVGGSAAAEIQRALPSSRVLKAFNTTFAATLSAGKVGGNVTAVLVAGDDGEAKAELVDLVRGSGLEAVDAGSLARAHELEALGFLQLTLAVGEKIGWAGGFALVK